MHKIKQKVKCHCALFSLKIIQQQSAIAQYLQNKLQLFDVKIKPIKDKYEFLEFLLSDLPLENFRPSHSTISIYFEIPTTHLPTLLNRIRDFLKSLKKVLVVQ